MPSLLLLVFFLQLAIHLVNTFGAQTINDVLWLLYTKLPTPQSASAAENARLKREVVRLQRELTATSAQDEFAKWARLRRDHDKAKERYERQSRDIESFKSLFMRAISAARWMGTQGLQFFCNFYFSSTPMFWLPKGWVPYQVEWVLSFPRAPLGSVSINLWALSCAAVIGMLSEGIRAVMTLKEGKVVGEKGKSNEGERLKKEL